MGSAVSSHWLQVMQERGNGRREGRQEDGSEGFEGQLR